MVLTSKRHIEHLEQMITLLQMEKDAYKQEYQKLVNRLLLTQGLPEVPKPQPQGLVDPFAEVDDDEVELEDNREAYDEEL